MDMLSVFRALGDPSRLRIMLLLQQMELSVGEIALVLEQSQPRVSRHIRILDEADLAERHKEGSWVFLRPKTGDMDPVAGQALAALLRAEMGGDSEISRQSRSDVARLQDVRAQRETQASEYFRAHAQEWDAIRSLYVGEAKVEKQLLAMIGDDRLGHLLDIGTGTGRMVELFAPQMTRATAIDNSPEMLRLARAKLQHLDQGLVELVQGDFNALPFGPAMFDTILLHQVLHYAQNPEQVITEAGRVAAPAGQIAIVDFAPHDLEELRTQDAHARLGFSDRQIEALLAQGGFAMEQCEELTGGKLTVKIWVGKRNRLSTTPNIKSATARIPKRSADNDKKPKPRKKVAA